MATQEEKKRRKGLIVILSILAALSLLLVAAAAAGLDTGIPWLQAWFDGNGRPSAGLQASGTGAIVNTNAGGLDSTEAGGSDSNSNGSGCFLGFICLNADVNARADGSNADANASADDDGISVIANGGSE